MLPSNHKVREQKREETIDNILSSASAQDQVNFSFSHSTLCHQLLPRTTGWENFFVREISKLKTLSESQHTKLERIATRHLSAAEENSRLCSHCGKKAQIIDQFSYYCPQCGNCLNYFWHEGGVR